MEKDLSMNYDVPKERRIRIESKPHIPFLLFSIRVEGRRGAESEHLVGKALPVLS